MWLYIIVILLILVEGCIFINKKKLQRISEFLIFNKRNNRIEQHLSLTTFINFSKKINFMNDDPTYSHIKEILRSKKELITFFKECKYDKVETITNQLMYEQLKDIENEEGIIKVSLKKEKKLKRQVLVKLSIMGIKTSIANVNNKSYRKFLLRKENVGRYVITINNI